MNEHCPDCAAPRVLDEPLALNVYRHAPTCALLLAERETFDSDARRHERFGGKVRHRAVTDAERALVIASGVKVGAREPLFCSVEFIAPDVRVRLFAGPQLVSVTEASSLDVGHAASLTVGATPSTRGARRTAGEATSWSEHLERSAHLAAGRQR